MLRSMTGFGAGSATVDGVTATAEFRTVNHRGLKLSLRLHPSNAKLETELDRLAKDLIRRGSVQLTVKVDDGSDGAVRTEINVPQVLAFYEAAREAAAAGQMQPPGDIAALLSLPGAVTTREVAFDEAAMAGAVEAAVREAAAALDAFRQTEGEALKTDLLAQLAVIRRSLSAVAERAPQVVEEYREKIRTRLGEILARNDLSVPDETIVREVAVFADRADVNEEIARLGCHLDQFQATLNGPDEVEGRKLDFLCQEMFREINTIGSKANDLTLSQTVVEMKSAAEKVREQVQNVE